MNRTSSSSALIASLLFVATAAQAATGGNQVMLNGKSAHGEIVAATQGALVVNVDAASRLHNSFCSAWERTRRKSHDQSIPSRGSRGDGRQSQATNVSPV